MIDKFNSAKGWNCQDFDDLKEKIEVGKREARIEANQIINSIRICDISVGSGHFLVSALNEIIAIKSELGILQDHSEKPKRITEYTITVENDELVICDEDGESFRYNPLNPVSQRIQNTLFEEKRLIIENCLFGVDLNPKSVEICRLRLWIELLKNAYYEHDDNGNRYLNTLPNIDINIKCGNSLASQAPVCIGKKIQSGIKKDTISKYKADVFDYKNCNSKENKHKLAEDIKALKKMLLPSVQLEMFDDNFNKEEKAKSATFKYSLEWMIEFPEVLSEDGTFEGFDVVIGNPPYISLEKLKTDAKNYASMRRIDEQGAHVKTYQTLNRRGDIYPLFVERGLQLLKHNGYLSYILPNKWQQVIYGQSLRKLFLDMQLEELVDFRDYQIFEDATTYTCIIRMKKTQRESNTIEISSMDKVVAETLPENIEERKEYFNVEEMDDGIWVTSSLWNFKKIKRLQRRMPSLNDYVKGESYRGIITGLSKAFNVDNTTKDILICKDSSSKDILRPFLKGRGLKAFGQAIAGSWLLFIPKGFTAKSMGINLEVDPLPSEKNAWEWFCASYPAVAEWLLPFKNKAATRTDKGDYWWELRACDYYDKFEQPKLFYQVFQTKPCFVYDDSSTFCNNSMYFMSTSDKSLLGILCSDMGWQLISEFCPRIQNGHQLIWDNFKQIPIPESLPSTIGELADNLMDALKENDTTKYNENFSKLNDIVNELYNV